MMDLSTVPNLPVTVVAGLPSCPRRRDAVPTLPDPPPLEQSSYPGRGMQIAPLSDRVHRAEALLRRCQATYRECCAALEAAHVAMERSREQGMVLEELRARYESLP